MHALTRKLFWLAFWVIGFAVFMTGLLLYFKYQSVFTGLQRDRVLMVAQEIDAIAEKNLSMGQDFWELATLQDVIERRRSADALFIGIDVAGKDGKIAYSTDLARIGTMLPAEWVAAFSRNARLTSLVPSQDLAMVASSIRNGFDQHTGYAVIRYTRQLEHEAMSSFTRRLFATCAIVFVVFTLVLFATLLACERHIERALSRAAAVARSAPGAAGAHALSRELVEIQSRADEANRAIASIEGALEPTR
jgi:hypothetical protein